jgi:acetylglutamate kinase
MQEISLPLVELLEAQGVQARALNGLTEDLMLAELTRPDLGYVGEVFAVRDVYLKKLLAENIIPVISSVAPSEDGDLINVNADLAASSIASALEASELVFFTDVPGLYTSWPDPDSLVSSITSAELEGLLPSLEAGMIPKVQACLAAIYGGVKVARMVDGSKAGSLGLLTRSEDNLGTKVVG